MFARTALMRPSVLHEVAAVERKRIVVLFCAEQFRRRQIFVCAPDRAERGVDQVRQIFFVRAVRTEKRRGIRRGMSVDCMKDQFPAEIHACRGKFLADSLYDIHADEAEVIAHETRDDTPLPEQRDSDFQVVMCSGVRARIEISGKSNSSCRGDDLGCDSDIDHFAISMTLPLFCAEACAASQSRMLWSASPASRGLPSSTDCA